MGLDDELEIFHGAATPTITRVYFRLHNAPTRGVITGQITGPYCRYARTLCTTLQFRRAPSQPDLWEVVFPDLCFWSAETPHWYRVSVRCVPERGEPEVVERMWSARQLKAVRGRLHWGEHPMRLRAVRATGEWPRELQPWRDNDVVMLVDAPSDALCREASEMGVPLCARLAPCTPDGAWRDRDSLLAEVTRLGRWPAVAVLFIEQASLVDASLLARAPNTLFAVRSGEHGSPHEALAHALICPVDSFHDQQAELEARGRPIIVVQPRQESTLPESRAACDALLAALDSSACLAGAVIW